MKTQKTNQISNLNSHNYFNTHNHLEPATDRRNHTGGCIRFRLRSC
jgi:hypothetical protein